MNDSRLCLDENALALWFDGAMPDNQREAVRTHLDGCELCQRLIGAAERTRASAVPQNPTLDAAQVSAAPLERGAIVGRYVILDQVGAGGMARVYAAYDPELDRKVALKLLHPHLRKLETLISREARAMARLSHPNVVAIYDVGRYEDQIFVAMEFVIGRTLHLTLRGSDRPWSEIVALFSEAGRGLEAAHRAGLVHGDFKPQNVLVRSDGRVLVTDFGLARATPTQGPNARSELPAFGNGPVGTPAYMALEQFEARPVDARTDVYGFFAALYEALHGEIPYPGQTPAEILKAIRAAKRPAMPNTSVPGWLNRVVLRGLQTLPDDRYPSMKEALRALGRQPSHRWRSAFAVTALAAVAAVTVLAVRARPDPLRACHDAASGFTGIWDEHQRELIESSFAATGRPYASEVEKRVAQEMNRFTAAWSTAYSAACEANVRHHAVDAVTYLRMACLSEQLAEARAKSELLARADAKLVDDATQMMSSLGDPARCDDRRTLQGLSAPKPELRPAVEQVRNTLMRAKSLDDAARYRDALPLAEGALQQANQIGWDPVRAEAMLRLAQTQLSFDEAAEALSSATDAAFTAETAADDALAAEAWTLAADIASDRLVLFDRATELERHAAVAIKRLGGDDYLLARLDNAIGDRLMREGQPDLARQAQLEAIALHEKTGRKDRYYAWAVNDEACALTLLGRNSEAADYFQRAVDLKASMLGQRHPDVGISRMNLGTVLMAAGRYDEAERQLDQAEAMFNEAGNTDLLLTSALDTDKGDLAFARHDYAKALARYERAVEEGSRVRPLMHQNVREAITGLGRTLLALKRPVEALANLERAIPPDPKVTDSADYGDLCSALARALVANGREGPRMRHFVEQARAAYRQSGLRGVKPLGELETWLKSLEAPRLAEHARRE